MTAPSYTYSLSNGTTADASQVMQDFNDILNGVTDGTKDLSINALTCAAIANLNAGVHIKGLNTAASAGNVGEVLSSGVLGGAITVTTGITALGSLALTAGNWLVFATLTMNGSGSTTSFLNCYLGTTSASASGTSQGSTYLLALANLTGVSGCGPLMTISTSSSPVTYYLNVSINSGTRSAGDILGQIIALRLNS